MNNKLIIGLAALGAAALYYLQGKKQAFENLTFTPLDIAINSAKTNFRRLVFNFKIKIGNPSPVNVKINNIDFDIFVNGRKVSEFQKTNFTTIAANDTGVIILEISIGNFEIIDAIFAAIADNGKIKVQIAGIIETDLGVASIDYNKTINV